MAEREYKSFSDFWPFYLREHSLPRTRMLHYVGTSLVVGLTVFGVLTVNWWVLIALPLAGYFFAWIAHFTVEKNRPATFTYPLWSLVADFRMWWLWLTGRLRPHLRNAGVASDPKR
ncbi:Mpo1-like protein [Altererythrobacter sp. MTPC7]|uniref:Mpo1-like protein n=1 Tax=Altererythrobacter sp. MTPC7 TaxID=3056567 RepID=UPI0036F2EE79